MGEYPEARFGTPGGVYGPDGSCISETVDGRSVADVDPAAAIRWRILYGNTMPLELGVRWGTCSENPDPYLEALEETGEPA